MLFGQIATFEIGAGANASALFLSVGFAEVLNIHSDPPRIDTLTDEISEELRGT